MRINFKNTKTIILASSLLLVILLGIGTYLYFFKKPSQKENQITHTSCLKDNEIATFNIIGNQTTATSADIIISNKNTSKELYRFKINNLLPPFRYYSYELHSCGIYVIREFNYDTKTRRATPGYRIELWKYDYNGAGRKILLFSETDSSGRYFSYYNDVFRIDPQEVYVSLEQRRTHSGEAIESLVIRNFNAQTDNFILKRTMLSEQFPQFIGLFQLRTWTRDGNYFWADLSIGAEREAFLRILRDTWKFDVLSAPKNTLGGTAFNPEYGYITYDTGPGWIGIKQVAEQVYDEWRKAGKKIDFYVYNLFTKEKTLLVTIDDPSWSFKPKWISDTELEYELPTGEKKIYKINE